MGKLALVIHGGAGTILKRNMTPEKEAAYTAALKVALDAGYELLEQGASAIDAVSCAVSSLEDSPLFNAGRGAVFTAEGSHEMDAAIMDGSNLEAGAVSLLKRVKNPVQLARLVMEKSEHVFLAGTGAETFAEQHNCTFETADYFHDDFRYAQWQKVQGTEKFQLDHSEAIAKENANSAGLEDKSAAANGADGDEKFGTVGAVAVDQNGKTAAATSTGGMTNKRFGRIGDSPIIGAGNYANDTTCAVSCTGSGEFFIRAVVAYDVSALIEHKGLPLKDACEEVIQKRLAAIKGDGGLIAVNAAGDVAMSFNTAGMYRACKTSSGREEIAIYKD